MVFSRKNRELLNEILVYLLYIFAVICAFWWLSANHLALARLFGIKDSVELDLGSIASILGIIAAALAIIISNRQQAYKELQTTRDQIYQQLELESINLFRFEIDNVELAGITWNDTLSYETLQQDTSKAYQVLQHICMVLNLFEMAVRFRRDGIAHEDVFRSWEAWIFDLCQSKMFLHFWYLGELKENYIKLFQDIIDDGLRCCHGKDAVTALKQQYTDANAYIYKDFRAAIKRHLV